MGSRSRRPRRRRRASPPRRSPRACSRRRARCVGRERCPSRPQKSCLGAQCKQPRDHGQVGVHATGAAGAAECWGGRITRGGQRLRGGTHARWGSHVCQQASAARGAPQRRLGQSPPPPPPPSSPHVPPPCAAPLPRCPNEAPRTDQRRDPDLGERTGEKVRGRQRDDHFDSTAPIRENVSNPHTPRTVPSEATAMPLGSAKRAVSAGLRGAAPRHLVVRISPLK